MTDKIRIQYQEELNHLEEQALGAFDLVVRALDRTLESIQNQDIQLAELVAADNDRIDGRYLEVHQPLSRSQEEFNSSLPAPLPMSTAVTRFIAHADSDSQLVKQALEQRSGMPIAINR